MGCTTMMNMFQLVVLSLVAVCGDSVAVCGDSRWVTGPCYVTCHVTRHVTRHVTAHVNRHRLGKVTRVTSLSLSNVTQYITQGNAQYCKWGSVVWSLWYRFYMDIMSPVWFWVIHVVSISIWHAISAVLCVMLPR